ncbi:hypothetical protein KR038_002169 [Drosophila bunnanda]|nr:hypothetical protein KR038_002169 [Drosophila bunnanda]
MESCTLEDYFSKENGQKMITAQECLKIKRDMDAENLPDFEASPLALCMMITLLLFGIGLWIWLISWSCFFGEYLEKGGKMESKKQNVFRLLGGKSNSPQKKEGTLTNRSNKDKSELGVRSRILRYCNPIADCDSAHLGSSRQGVQTSSATGGRETEMVEAPTTYGTTASSSVKESPKPRRKYKIKWTKLLKLRRSEESVN